MATTSQNQVLTSVRELLASGAYSDLIIKCGDDTYKVHKAVVCNRAEFFARAIEFSGQEARSGTVDLSKDPSDSVRLLIQYLYEGEYDPALPPQVSIIELPGPVRRLRDSYGVTYSYHFPHTCHLRSTHSYQCAAPEVCPHHNCQNCDSSCDQYICPTCCPPSLRNPSVEGTANQMLVHTQMYELGEKYQVIGLKDLSKEKFLRSCQKFWNTPQFPAAAAHAFSTTVDEDKGLREIAIDIISNHKELVLRPEMREVLERFNGLAMRVMETIVRQVRDLE